MPNKKTSKNKIILCFLSIIILYAISYLMLKGVGAPRSFFHTMLLVFLITLGSASKRFFWFIVFPLITLYALYTPIGFAYGALTYDFLIAGFATDTLEIQEFIHQIPYENYLLPAIIISGLLLYRKIIVKYQIQFYKNRTYLLIAVLCFIALQSPTYFIRELKQNIEKLYNEMGLLASAIKEPSWGDSTLTNSKYDNYILIIGESARRDYLHAYGYPINNTPFMSSTNGILIDGLAAGGPSTVPSLKAMLTYSSKKDWEADYSKTFIDLAKSANVETYWLSNQGYFGTHDTPISVIASGSGHSHFLKYGTAGSANISDFELLKYFKEIIEQNPKQKKLIVMHLYGSHPNACDRVKDFSLITKVSDHYYDYINCYISSIHQTDQLLEEITLLLQQELVKQDASFSLLYFSDHGQVHNEINGKLYFNNHHVSKFHYDIPLFMTASDIHNRTQCQSFKSGLNFTNGIANWIGISNKQLDPYYSLFDCQNDPDDFGLSLRLEGIEPDPAIDISNK